MGILSEFNFDDFYKFIMSSGILIIIISLIISFYLSNWYMWILTFIIFLIVGKKLIYWAGKKWYANQKILDEKLRAQNELIKKGSSETSFKDKLSKKEVALIEYKIDSVLHGTVHYDLIKDGKVWFWLKNLTDKAYKVYINVEYISGSYSQKSDYNYYNGGKEWNLNAFTGIRAPGMDIPKKFIELAKKGKQVQIKINCEVKDENNEFIERKLPISFIYDSQNKSWFLEP